MAWEYRNQHGQAQEDLPDHLTMASLYGIWVVEPGYQSASHQPATVQQTEAVVNTDVWPVGYMVEADQNSIAFTCPQLECSVVGLPFYFDTL